MPAKTDYTTLAQRFTSRFPLLTFLMTQVNFWIFANILLVLIMHLHERSIASTIKIEASSRLAPLLLIATSMGIVYGLCLGLVDYFLDKGIFRKKSLGRIILSKTIISFFVLSLIINLLRFVLFDLFKPVSYNFSMTTPSKQSWKYMFFMLAVFYFFMTLVISFINQVNKKYGPGVLIPLLLGRYRNPREEERIFMFMDLKSSTTIAENLGHLQYSAFIRDCFMDINQVLFHYNAQVYQYVGDEVVITWNSGEGLKQFACIRFYFACEKRFLDKAQYYIKNYGAPPIFKAGVHMGKVTAVEIGEIKRDIAYHGDTLNTTARIQSVCNEYNKKLLVSETLLDIIGPDVRLKADPLGLIKLKGKVESVGIAGVDWTE